MIMVEGTKEIITNDDRHGCFKAIALKAEKKMVELSNNTKNVGKDDPRRIVHSFKLGLAVTIVSLFFYFEPLYDNLGASSLWAIITVIVIFEFSVGATLGKGLNRTLATSLAGGLGFGAHYISSVSGKICHPILLGILIYIISAITSYYRFIPKLKARYDYGLLIFMMTFDMVAVSGFRNGEILKLAWHRLANIVVGAFVAMLICIFVKPVWAGADLHHLVATNVENLGIFIEGFGSESFGASQGEFDVGGEYMLKYKSVLSSRQNEEALTYQARWEPPHGKFRIDHPWKHYRNIANFSRDCASRFEILNGYLNSDHIQLPLEIERQYQEQCLQVCTESGRALKAMAIAIRDIVPPVLAKSHIEIAKKTVEELMSGLTSSHFNGHINLVSTTTLVLLLIDSFSCVEKMVDSVHEFVSLARLNIALQQSGVTATEQKGSGDEASSQNHHIITITQTRLPK